MSTYTQILYQIVFSTKDRNCCLTKEHKKDFFKYIWGIIEHKNCHLYQLNGVEDHIHILTSLHPSIALADLVKDIKVAGSKFIKANNLFPEFDGWQNGYGAFTYSINQKDNLINYIKNQEEHHLKISFKEEYIALLAEHNIKFEEQYLF